MARAEFDRFELVRETKWAEPDRSFIVVDGDRVACFYNLILRTVRFDGESIRVAGVNSLVTVPGYRGRGIASHLLRDTEASWFESLGATCGLLLCADTLLPFYERLGWHAVDATVRYSQSSGRKKWPANCMLRAPSDLVRPQDIDLCGPPW